MFKAIFSMFKHAAVVAALGASALVGTAQAGVITGNYDPEFGAGLPGWSYRGSFTGSLPDYLLQFAIDNDTDGFALASPLYISVTAELFQTDNLGPSAIQTSMTLSVTWLTFDRTRGLLVDWGADPTPVALSSWNALDLGSGVFHDFTFSWQNLRNGPTIRCTDCAVVGPTASVAGGVDASVNGMILVVDQERDNGSDAGGFRTAFSQDGNGVISSETTFRDVPAPGSLLLALGGLLALAIARRRQCA